MDKYDVLKLDNQLCFPLYAASREVVKKYHPLLSRLDLTYTQYITMMVMWERREISAKEIGERLLLDSGTLTPVLRSLEKKGLITRKRADSDERVLLCTVTPAGMELREQAVGIPTELAGCVALSPEEARSLYHLLYKLLGRE
ncbi:MAG: MarR family transcriptional regulator [Lachnospiraceae bacterium]|nr:MarR family transcriptional regulator [Lachnospiraceae bacterium]